MNRIFHIGAWNRNIGDWTMGYNTHRILENLAEKRGKNLSFYLIDSQRGEFHDALIQQINEEASLLLIGGGGMIFNRPADESASGWAFNITEERLKEIKIPMFVFAIGYNKFYFDKRNEYSENESPKILEPIFEYNNGKLSKKNIARSQ